MSNSWGFPAYATSRSGPWEPEADRFLGSIIERSCIGTNNKVNLQLIAK
jgi:hypothetical protein